MFKHILQMAACSTLSACTVPKTDYTGSYVGGDATTLIQLQIVEGENGQISGSVAASELDYTAGNLKQTTKAITGIRRDKQFSLLAHHNQWGGSDAPVALEADGNALLLKIPTTGQSLELTKMDQDQYRVRLVKFASALDANDVGLVSEE